MLDTLPKVSIVIPVYNGSNFLAEAIDSALAQTYKNIEIIVVDDGSTDGGATEKVAQGYGSQICYYRKDNGGASSALNFGIGKMTGDYFSWLSHDDLLSPDKTQIQVDYCVKNDVKFICGEFEKIDAEKKLITKITQSKYDVIKTGRQALSVYIFGCTTLIHRSCFDTVGLFNVDNRTTSDDEMWVRLIKYYPLHYLRQVMCKERQHAAQVGIRDAIVHGQNKYLYFKYIYDECDIDWFVEDSIYASGKIDDAARSEACDWIGRYALRLGCFQGADLFFRRALKFSPLNLSAALQLLLRPRNIYNVRARGIALMRKFSS